MNPRRSPLLSVLTGGATRPGAASAPGDGRELPIQTSLPDPDLGPDDDDDLPADYDPEGDLGDLGDEELVDDLGDEEPEYTPRADMWKVYQMGPKGPTWIHTERECAVTEETLLAMFGPGTFRVVAHLKGRENGSYLVRIGTPETATPTAQARQLSTSPQAIPWELIDRMRPAAPPNELVIAERVARLLKMTNNVPPPPPARSLRSLAPVPESDLGDDDRPPAALDWPEAILHLADLVAEKFTPAGAPARIESATVLTYLREPGVLEEVLGHALADPEISARIATHLGGSAEVPSV